MAPNFRPVYFFPGPEIGRKRERINALRESLAAKDKEEPEWHRFYPYDTQAADVISILQNGSLFSSRRVVVLADAHALKTDGIKTFIKYIKSPSPDAVLIFTTDHAPGSREYPRKLADALPKSSTEVFWEMFERDKRGWVTHFLREKGLRIDEDAVALLLDVTEGTTDALREACERLCFAADSGAMIDEEDVEKVLEHGRAETVYSLFDRFCRRDLGGVLEAYQKMRHSDPGTADRFLMMLADPLVHLMDFKSRVSKGLTEDSAARELKLRGGKRALRSYRDGAHHFSNTELRNAMRSLIDLEAWLRKRSP